MVKEELYTSSRLSNAQRAFWSFTDFIVPGRSAMMVTEADASAMDEIRSQAKKNGDEAPSYTAFLIKAAGLTMRKHPQANQAILGPFFFRRLYKFNNFDVSVAIEKNLPTLPGQAMAAVIREAPERSLNAITQELQRLRDCTSENEPVLHQLENVLKYVPWPLSKLVFRIPYYIPSQWVQYRGCACWVNAPAKAGVNLTVTSWHWPITFSCGLVAERPWVVDGQVTVRRIMPLTISFDRRIMGGGPASRILQSFKYLLENAATELV